MYDTIMIFPTGPNSYIERSRLFVMNAGIAGRRTHILQNCIENRPTQCLGGSPRWNEKSI